MFATLTSEEIVEFVLIDIALILVVARAVGALFRRIGQPPVVGEIIAGILLGPTLLGQFSVDGEPLTDRIFPLEVQPYLNVVAQLGLVIFMFVVGLELDVSLIRGKERLAGVISVSSVALPFTLGIGLAAVLHSSHDSVGESDFLPFALFIGASMSITAFPVLARILNERGMHRIDVGALALACAAVDDILAWSLLAVVIAVVESSGAGELPRIVGLSIAYVAFMFVVVRPLLGRLVDRYRATGHLTNGVLSVILIGVLVSSWVTSMIGIHQIFGAFLFGVVMPREATKEMFHEILLRIESITVLLLLPVFFIVTGLKVDVSQVGPDGFAELALILLVAVSGKFVGAAGAARLQGLPARKATALGILMNTRGLTELVILNVGRELDVLDDELFTLLVLMAVVTTVMTEPLLRLIYPDRLLRRDIADAERTALGLGGTYRVLVAVDEPTAASAGVALAADIVGREAGGEVILSRFMPSAVRLDVGTGLSGELADMASSLDALHALAGVVEAQGCRATVSSRFSDQPTEDLLRQIASTEVDVVVGIVAGDRDEVVEALRGLTDRDVAILDERPGEASLAGPRPDAPVLVADGDGPSDAAALELAVRIALARGLPLKLLSRAKDRRTTKRLDGIRAEITGLGVSSEVVSGIDGELSLLVLADGAGPVADSHDSALLVVRAKEALAPLGGRERLAAIGSSAIPEAPDPRP